MTDNFRFGTAGRILLRLSLMLVLCGLLFFIVSKSLRGPLHLWDEALYASNALDMAKNRQYLVYTVADTIDHYNTKPPLVIWMQAAAGASLGFSELSVRLPTYLALVGVLALLCVYLRRFTGSILPGLLASLFCLTANGLIRHHVFLTGDLDGVLVFWTTWIVLHWSHCLRKEAVIPADYVVLTSLFCAGYLTKSTAVLLIVPSLFVIGCFYWQRLRTIIASRRTGLSIVAFAAVCATYYLVREYYDPGHWAVVWQSEFTRLSEDVQPWLHFPFSYYFELFYDPLFHEYLLLLAALSVPFFIIRRCAHKRLVIALLSGAAVYMVFISIPPVKLEWYNAPVYPLLCGAIAIMLWELVTIGLMSMSAWRVAAVSALLIVAAITVKNSFLRVEKELADEPHSGFAHQTLPDALKIFHDRYPEINSFNVLVPPTPKRFAHVLDELTFYKTVYQCYERKTVKVSDLATSFGTGDTLICNREALGQIAKDYSIVPLDSTAGGAMWVFLSSALPATTLQLITETKTD